MGTRKKGDKLPTFEEFKVFLNSKADLLETLEQKLDSKPKNKHKNTVMVSNTYTCNFCKGAHMIYNCKNFQKLSVIERKNKVKELGLCENCLRTNHTTNKCFLRGCKICKEKHNSMLHVQKDEKSSESEPQVVLSSNDFNQNTMLCTAIVQVTSDGKHFKNCRTLLDSGSQSNFITYRLCQKIGCNLEKTDISITGIGKVQSKINLKCVVTIKSQHTKFIAKIPCLVIANISETIPAEEIDISRFTFPTDAKLADPLFHKQSQVDLLIGAGLFWEIIGGNKIAIPRSSFALRDSKLGWLVSGKIPNKFNSQCNLLTRNENEFELLNQLKRFWEIEEYETSSTLSKDEEECERQFKESFFRNAQGRFVVKLPLKESPTKLGNSYNTALKRFLMLEKKLDTSPIKNDYVDFMKVYRDLSHMSEIQSSDRLKTEYFIPHHAVVREESLTTKLRVVFDASSASDTGVSLNDLQYVGPKVITDIFSILVRFRLHSYVFSSDISKMYRQILLHPEHRSLHRILWRECSDDKVAIFELNTVTYGTTAAPYLAIRCIRELANQNEQNYPKASKVILEDIYVDDIISGANSIKEAQLMVKQIIEILQSGGFQTHKWKSNDSRILEAIPEFNKLNESESLGNSISCKTLGILWHDKTDTLAFKINKSVYDQTITKRQLLSEVAQIYDPLGLLSPCTVIPKITLQQLWRCQISWDDPVPVELGRRWLQFRNELSAINDLRIPRHVLQNSYETIELHGFCDASLEAYAACIYARTQSNETVKTQLICAKTKVAPLKSLTIPRLELCGAVLLTKLMKGVEMAMSIKVNCHYWTDSQIVLCWLVTEPSKLQSFVANRVSFIQSTSVIHNWRHVRSKDNPADLASRSVSPKLLKDVELWWSGAKLLKDSNNWLTSTQQSFNIEIPELKRKKVVSCAAAMLKKFELFSKYSSLTKLKRVLAYCFRFAKNCRTIPNDRNVNPLTVSELDHVLVVLIKISQQESLLKEIECISKGDQKHKLLSLSPFLDEKGILRVGGRLTNSVLPFNRKHPMLLCSSHELTKMLFREEHIRLLHTGPQHLLASIRRNFWPIGGEI